MAASNRLAEKLLSLMPEPGLLITDVDHMTLIRNDEVQKVRTPIIYEPSIYIVVQGSKSAELRDERFVYDALNYLVLSVPLPLECRILQASSEQPYLAVRIDINTQLLNDLIQDEAAPSKATPASVERGIFVSRLGDDIKSTLERLLSYVNDPTSAKVLGDLAIKELLFHVLQGAQGELLRAFAYRDKHSFNIAQVIHFIQSHYAENMDVAKLAAKANMSASSFHSYFKAVTNSTPIQYIKAIRLHEARRRMLFDNQSASDAAFNVGYASPSQFSREYRRFFGEAPTAGRRQNSL